MLNKGTEGLLAGLVRVSALEKLTCVKLRSIGFAFVNCNVRRYVTGPLLGDVYPAAVWLSLLPIVLGCSMAAMKEVSFSMGGFAGAMVSNIAMVMRNITSKKQLNDFKMIDGINLYGLLAIVGLFYTIPAALVMEGPAQWSAGWTKAVADVGLRKMVELLVGSGVFYHLYNQVSYQALTEISPVTFSVGNSLKRIAVIVASVIYFRNPVAPLNAAGSALALLGAFLYTQVGTDRRIMPSNIPFWVLWRYFGYFQQLHIMYFWVLWMLFGYFIQHRSM